MTINVNRDNRHETTERQSIEIDLFRISKSKKVADVTPPTVRGYIQRGLPCYKQGRATFISKRELEHFIRNPEAFSKKRGGR